METSEEKTGGDCKANFRRVEAVTHSNEVWAWVQYVKITVKWKSPSKGSGGSTGSWDYDSEGGYDEDGKRSDTGSYGKQGSAGGKKNSNHPFYGHQARVGDKIGMRDTPGVEGMSMGTHANMAGAERARGTFIQLIQEEYGVSVPADATWIELTQDFETYLIDTANHKVKGAWRWKVVTTWTPTGVSAIGTKPKKFAK